MSRRFSSSKRGRGPSTITIDAGECLDQWTIVYGRLQFTRVTDLAANLRTAREAAGLSLSALAKRTHFSKSLLGHLETGNRVVRREHVVSYAQALNIAVDALYNGPDDPLRRAHEWLVSDTPVTRHSSTGRRVGTSLAVEMEQRVIELRHLDDVVTGGDLSPVVHHELSEAWRMLAETSYSQETGRRLLTVTGELAQLAGWVASDAGYFLQAQHVYLSGVTAAHEAGNRALGGQLLSSLAYQIANIGAPEDAELLARSALAGVGDATPLVRALLLERLAWSSARARHEDSARRALDAVDDAYDARASDIGEPEWVYWLDRSEIDVMAGRCFIELGQPYHAEPLLTSAIANYDANHSREVALYRTWLAEAYAGSGEIDAARETIRQADEASRHLHSARLDRRIADVVRLIDD